MLKPNEVELLLSGLCIKLGFCLYPSEIERLSKAPPVEVGAFTDALFMAEGMDPEMADRRLYRKVKTTVRNAFEKSEAGQSKGHELAS